MALGKNFPKPRAEKAFNWRGGRCKTNFGYILIRLQPDDPFYPMADHHGYAMEGRLVVAQELGRCLNGQLELVHHINGVKDDNRVENLQLMSPSEHQRLHKGFGLPNNRCWYN